MILFAKPAVYLFVNERKMFRKKLPVSVDKNPIPGEAAGDGQRLVVARYFKNIIPGFDGRAFKEADKNILFADSSDD